MTCPEAPLYWRARPRWSLLSLLLVAVVACEWLGGSGGPGDEEDRGEVVVTFALAGPSDRLVVDHLSLSVAELVYDAEGPEGSVSITADQRREVEVVPPESPALAPLIVHAGTHRSVEIGVDLWEGGSWPPLLLEGALDGVPLRLVVGTAESFAWTAPSLEVPAGGAARPRFVMDPEGWFAGIAGGSLDQEGGVAIVDEEHNSDVYDLVVDRLEGSLASWDPEDTGEPWDTGDTGWDR